MANNNENQNNVVSTHLPSNKQMNVLTQEDAIGFGMNASNGRKKNGVTHFKTHLKFKKLTFHKVIHEVIKPTLLSNLPKYIL